MKPTLSLGTLPSDPPREREASEVSTADAAAFLATLASAIHAVTQPLSALNGGDPLDGALVDSAGAEGVFEAELTEIAEPAEPAGETLSRGLITGVDDNSVIATVPARNMPALSAAANAPIPVLIPQTPGPNDVALNVALDVAKLASTQLSDAGAQTFDGSRNLVDENTAPALLRPIRTAQLPAAASTPAVEQSGTAVTASADPRGSEGGTLSAKLSPPLVHQSTAFEGAQAESSAPENVASKNVASGNTSAAKNGPNTPVAAPTTNGSPVAAPTTPEIAVAVQASSDNSEVVKNTSENSVAAKNTSENSGVAKNTSENLASDNTPRTRAMSAHSSALPNNMRLEKAPVDGADIAPISPRQDPGAPLVLKVQDALTAPPMSHVAAENTSKQNTRQTNSAEGAPTLGEAPQDSHAPVQMDLRHTGRRPHADAAVSADTSSYQTGEQPPAPDGVELAAPNPEPSGIDGSLADVHTGPVSLEATATSSLASDAEARPSSSSRLLEHLRESFPAAEVRISEGRAGETLVSMNHPDFGAVELNLQITSSGIDIAARVDGAIAASLLRRSETSLRQTIHRRGLSLGRLRIERNQKHPSRRSERGIDLEA
ncbi:MAG: hypothetical protein ACI9KE_000443 [Polyangiales bacterium]|jgi:hypothetical protein